MAARVFIGKRLLLWVIALAMARGPALCKRWEMAPEGSEGSASQEVKKNAFQQAGAHFPSGHCQAAASRLFSRLRTMNSRSAGV
jgi:hypothetical protein